MKVSWSTTGRAHRLSLGELLEGLNRSGSHPFHPAPFAGRTGVRVGARIVGPDHVALPIAPVVLARHRHLHRLVRPIWIEKGWTPPRFSRTAKFLRSWLSLRSSVTCCQFFCDQSRYCRAASPNAAEFCRFCCMTPRMPNAPPLVAEIWSATWGSHVAYPLHWSARASAAVIAMVTES